MFLLPVSHILQVLRAQSLTITGLATPSTDGCFLAILSPLPGPLTVLLTCVL